LPEVLYEIKLCTLSPGKAVFEKSLVTNIYSPTPLYFVSAEIGKQPPESP
jgi:hypothetical protein